MYDKKYTDTQSEIIYAYNQIENEEQTNKKLSEFFSILVKRRINISFSEGLQAACVIFSDKCAMKVCEDDGQGPHLNALVNLTKYLNNDHKYITVDATGYFRLSQNERRQLTENGIEITIIDQVERIRFMITSHISVLSAYQVKMLNNILLCCKLFQDNKTYEQVELFIDAPSCSIHFEYLTNDHYEYIINEINKMQDKSFSNI